MASTYTANSGIEKPGSGEQSGTWGDTTNTNFDIIDRAINGVGAITLSGTTHTLTTTDGSLSDGGYKVLVLGGSPSGTNTITISPNDQDKVYLVKNGSGQTATFTQGSGGNASVANGDMAWIFADGAGSSAAITTFTVNTSQISDSAITTAKIADGTIATADIADSAITSAKIADGTIATADIADDAVTSAKIADTTIVAGNIANNTITATQIAADAIGSSELANNAVDTAAIADSAVTTAKIADSAITSAKIADGTIVAADIASDAITNAKMADDSVGAAELVDNSVGAAAINISGNGTSGQYVTSDGDGSFSYTTPAAAFLSGMIMPYAGSSAPSGWLLLYGQAISRSTYSSLFSAIGTTYGSGDGSSTFNVPDLRGRTIAGQDDMGGSSADRLTNQTGGVNGDTLGGTGGSETHTLTTAQLAAHTHGAGSYATSLPLSGNDTDGGQGSRGSNNPQNFALSGTSGSTGSGSAHNNVQPTLILNYIIKT